MNAQTVTPADLIHHVDRRATCARCAAPVFTFATDAHGDRYCGTCVRNGHAHRVVGRTLAAVPATPEPVPAAPAETVPALPGLLTAEEWWAEYHANECCPSAEHARRTLCGCGGPASLHGVSRLLTDH